MGNVHLIAGGAERVAAVLAMLRAAGVKTDGNPDIYIRSYQSFGIDEARELRERANSRAISGEHRIFILAMPGMTNEAQNALLKTLEEPPAGAQFFFIIPSPSSLLPTLRSRAQMLSLGARETEVSIVNAEKFLAAAPEKRLDMLKLLLEKDDDDPPRLAGASRREAGKRDLGAIITFLSSLERALGVRRTDAGAVEGLEATYRARKYIGDKGALVKPLLEQVALLIPRI